MKSKLDKRKPWLKTEGFLSTRSSITIERRIALLTFHIPNSISRAISKLVMFKKLDVYATLAYSNYTNLETDTLIWGATSNKNLKYVTSV